MTILSGILVAWREVKTIVLVLISAAALTWLLRLRYVSLLCASFLGWVFYFFRDPEREPVSTSADWILAPADGKVMDVVLVNEPYFLEGQARRVSVFLSLFDVHVQRSPYQGMVQYMRYQPGSFVPAFLRQSDENEANLIGLATPRGALAVKQISGVLARRIVCWPQIGDHLSIGERLGLIRFGSRVDLFLPPEVEVLVHKGQQVYGGQTIMARWPRPMP